MISVVLDTNIYDRLEADRGIVERVLQLVDVGEISVLMPRQVAAELHARPQGFPDLFPTQLIGHAVARAGIACAGDYIGTGEVYDAHRGESQSHADAFIVDVAAMAADWFVSEDRRSLRRFPNAGRCIAMGYHAFTERLAALA